MSSTVSTRRRVAEPVGLVAVLAAVALAMAVPEVLDWNVHVNFFPPVHAEWMPRVGPGTLPALVLGALACWRGVALAESLTWGRLLLLAYVRRAGVDARPRARSTAGTGSARSSQYKYEYLPTARAGRRPARDPRRVHGAHPVLRRRPALAGALAGHPPGALTFFVALVRLGLGGGLAAGLVATLFAATTALAVLVTLRALGAERTARRAAPFLVIGPGRDLAVRLGRRDVRRLRGLGHGRARGRVRAPLAGAGRVVAGLLLGWAVMMSYGLPLLGFLALAVLVAGRLVAAAACRRRWPRWRWCSRSRRSASPGGRPSASCTTATGTGSPRTARRRTGCGATSPPWPSAPGRWSAPGWRGPWRPGARCSATAETRVVLVLTGAAAAIVLAADLSQMSKAEVERIWLPFVPWLLISSALLPRRWRTCGLARPGGRRPGRAAPAQPAGERPAQPRSGAVANSASPCSGVIAAVKPSSRGPAPGRRRRGGRRRSGTPR